MQFSVLLSTPALPKNNKGFAHDPNRTVFYSHRQILDMFVLILPFLVRAFAFHIPKNENLEPSNSIQISPRTGQYGHMWLISISYLQPLTIFSERFPRGHSENIYQKGGNVTLSSECSNTNLRMFQSQNCRFLSISKYETANQNNSSSISPLRPSSLWLHFLTSLIFFPPHVHN